VPSVFQNADRHDDTLEHYSAELMMGKNWMLVCSKDKLEIPNQYTVTLEEELSFPGMCNVPLNCKNTTTWSITGMPKKAPEEELYSLVTWSSAFHGWSRSVLWWWKASGSYLPCFHCA
jgi:hypothetical protein